MRMFNIILVATLFAFSISGKAQHLDDQAPEAAPARQAGVQKIPAVRVSARQKFDPLHMNVIMQFPSNVKTVQQAAQYLLETAKYKLVLNPADPEASRQILSRSLLPQDVDGSLQTIENALLLIGGDDTILIIDRTNKLISFEFLPK